MVSRGRHQKKEVADALCAAEPAGLSVVELHSGHRWGEVTCEECESTREVWSTPRNPGVHAKQLKRFIARHTHE
jgi:hypothetical protein